jgi:serine/threonine protein kinase
VHGSLHHFLKAEAQHGVRVTMPLIYRFALDIARGVGYLHRRCNVVQRDLKARNILVDQSLNAKVSDFGLSRVIDDQVSAKLTACGTPAWTAPEIVKMVRLHVVPPGLVSRSYTNQLKMHVRRSATLTKLMYILSASFCGKS